MSGVMMALLASTSQAGVFELVASGKTSGGFAAVYTSADGVNWYEKITTAPSSFNRIFSTKDLLLATTTESPNRNIYYSTDGTEWFDASGTYNYDLNAITYNENGDGTLKAKWLVAGGKYLDSFIVDSELGTESWNDTNVANGNRLNSIYYSPSRDIYIAAGDSGTLFVSSSGKPGSWTKVDFPSTVDIKSLAYNPTSNNFVSVGTGGAILYASEPTSTWTIATLTPQAELSTYDGYQGPLYSAADFSGYGTEQYARDFAGTYEGTNYSVDGADYITDTYVTDYSTDNVGDYSRDFTANFESPATLYAGTYDGSLYDKVYDGTLYDLSFFSSYVSGESNYDVTYDTDYTNSYTLTYVLDGAYNTVYNNQTADFSPIGPIYIPDPYDTDYAGPGADYDSTAYAIDYTRTYTTTFSTPGLSFLGTFNTSYEGSYATDYEGTYEGASYQATFSSTYAGEYTGISSTVTYTADYTGNYQGAYISSYTSGYEGQYQGPSVDSTDFNAVVCSSASNLMVAVGDNRVVMTSSDGGVTWINRSSDAAIQAIDPSANIVDVTYSVSLNKFFAVTNDTLYPIIFSQDGITWTAPDIGSLETSELKSISAKSKVLL